MDQSQITYWYYHEAMNHTIVNEKIISIKLKINTQRKEIGNIILRIQNSVFMTRLH